MSLAVAMLNITKAEGSAESVRGQTSPRVSVAAFTTCLGGAMPSVL